MSATTTPHSAAARRPARPGRLADAGRKHIDLDRWADPQDARAAELNLSGWIVVRFEPGALTADERTEFVTSLDCINVGTTEDGVEC